MPRGTARGDAQDRKGYYEATVSMGAKGCDEHEARCTENQCGNANVVGSTGRVRCRTLRRQPNSSLRDKHGRETQEHPSAEWSGNQAEKAGL